MAKTTIFEAALLATIISVGYPILVIFLLVLPADLFGFPLNWVYLPYAIVGGVGGYFLYRRYLPEVKGADFAKKGDFEKVVAMFGLLFGLGGSLFTLGSFYDRTVTNSTCANPPTVNVTSPNCKVIQTVTIPQIGGYGNFGSLVLLITVIALRVFAIWVVTFSYMSKLGL